LRRDARGLCHAHMRVESPRTVTGDDTAIGFAAEGTSGTELTETLGQMPEVMS